MSEESVEEYFKWLKAPGNGDIKHSWQLRAAFRAGYQAAKENAQKEADPQPPALYLRPCGHRWESTLKNSLTGVTSCAECDKPVGAGHKDGMYIKDGICQTCGRRVISDGG